jgi:hypothetical protein
MTKKEALQDFRESILPSVIKRYGKKDKVAISEAWCDYTDRLAKDGMITRHQDQTWTNYTAESMGY